MENKKSRKLVTIPSAQNSGMQSCADVAGPPPCTFEPDTMCSDALATMASWDADTAAVCVGKRLFGVLTLSDFRKLHSRPANGTYVLSIMTPLRHLVHVLPSASVAAAMSTLLESGHEQLPVVDGCDHLVGFISRWPYVARRG